MGPTENQQGTGTPAADSGAPSAMPAMPPTGGAMSGAPDAGASMSMGSVPVSDANASMGMGGAAMPAEPDPNAVSMSDETSTAMPEAPAGPAMAMPADPAAPAAGADNGMPSDPTAGVPGAAPQQ